jgi:hypothetical protein
MSIQRTYSRWDVCSGPACILNTLGLTHYIDNDLPSDARIGGIAIPLDSEFQLDENTTSYFTEVASHIASQIDLLGEGNPFADEHRVQDCESNVVSNSCVLTWNQLKLMQNTNPDQPQTLQRSLAMGELQHQLILVLREHLATTIIFSTIVMLPRTQPFKHRL